MQGVQLDLLSPRLSGCPELSLVRPLGVIRKGEPKKRTILRNRSPRKTEVRGGNESHLGLLAGGANYGENGRDRDISAQVIRVNIRHPGDVINGSARRHVDIQRDNVEQRPEPELEKRLQRAHDIYLGQRKTRAKTSVARKPSRASDILSLPKFNIEQSKEPSRNVPDSVDYRYKRSKTTLSPPSDAAKLGSFSKYTFVTPGDASKNGKQIYRETIKPAVLPEDMSSTLLGKFRQGSKSSKRSYTRNNEIISPVTKREKTIADTGTLNKLRREKPQAYVYCNRPVDNPGTEQERDIDMLDITLERIVNLSSPRSIESGTPRAVNWRIMYGMGPDVTRGSTISELNLSSDSKSGSHSLSSARNHFEHLSVQDQIDRRSNGSFSSTPRTTPRTISVDEFSYRSNSRTKTGTCIPTREAESEPEQIDRGLKMRVPVLKYTSNKDKPRMRMLDREIMESPCLMCQMGLPTKCSAIETYCPPNTPRVASPMYAQEDIFVNKLVGAI